MRRKKHGEYRVEPTDADTALVCSTCSRGYYSALKQARIVPFDNRLSYELRYGCGRRESDGSSCRAVAQAAFNRLYYGWECFN